MFRTALLHPIAPGASPVMIDLARAEVSLGALGSFSDFARFRQEDSLIHGAEPREVLVPSSNSY